MFKVFVEAQKRGMQCSSRGIRIDEARTEEVKEEARERMRKRGSEANIAREREREVAIG